MKKRIMMMKLFTYLPIIIAGMRILLTLQTFIWNTAALPYRYFQVIPLIVLLVSLFKYIKLFMDGEPIITLISPTLIHAVIYYVFTKSLVILPFLVFLGVDILFLVSRGYKSSMYPFEIEDEDMEDLSKLFDDKEDATTE